MADLVYIGLFQCPACEWAATTGAEWDVCPHCNSKATPQEINVIPFVAVEAWSAEIEDHLDEKHRRRDDVQTVDDPGERWASSTWNNALEFATMRFGRMLRDRLKEQINGDS